jgi:hypothetical protein
MKLEVGRSFTACLRYCMLDCRRHFWRSSRRKLPAREDEEHVRSVVVVQAGITGSRDRKFPVPGDIGSR